MQALWRRRLLLVASLLLMVAGSGQLLAQTPTDREFTDEHPLVYEDAWDLWPYVFLNENGDAVGYNVDLLREVFHELNIPYVIKLKPTKEALNDLKNGQSDLMLGMDAHFHNEYAEYGKSVIQIFTHSIAHRKSEQPKVKTTEDLARHRVAVHGGSFSHHYMMQHGWGDNALPYDDMRDAMQRAHNEQGLQIVWNTMSLKWLINNYHFDNLQLTPVSMQSGEYKFMSNNPALLNKLDSVFTLLNSSGRLQAIQNKWFYPERRDSGIPSWIWQVVVALILFATIVISIIVIYKVREIRLTDELRHSNDRLSLVLHTSGVHTWLFNIAQQTFSRLEDDGSWSLPVATALIEFMPADRERLLTALKEFESNPSLQSEKTLEGIRSIDEEGNERNLTIHLSVFRRDKGGKATDIMETISDTTAERMRQQKVKDDRVRYQAIFDSSMVDTMAFGADRLLTDMNIKAEQTFGADKQTLIGQGFTLSDVLGELDFDFTTDQSEYLTLRFVAATDTRRICQYQKRGQFNYEVLMTPVFDANNQLLAIYVTGRDVTDIAVSYSRLRSNSQKISQASGEVEEYINNIDFVLHNGGVRMATYQPDTHELTIYNSINHAQYKLTQMRMLMMTKPESRRTVHHLLSSLDRHANASLTAEVETALRRRDGKPLALSVSFVPVTDEHGAVTSYFGMVRDSSDIKATEKELARETLRAQEVETVKNAFLRNMSYEIRTPLTSVVGFAELFSQKHDAEDDKVFINEIKNNSKQLLELINDILFISRLDAGMIEMQTSPVDFAQIFESLCHDAWLNYKHDGVEYLVDKTYNKLVVDINQQNVSIIVRNIVANAAQNTTEGRVRARYDFTGADLLIAVQDTGCGIPADRLDRIYDRFMTSDSQRTGLGLSICHELLRQMGGKITISSEVGKGTTVWITIPCSCHEFERIS